jgi:uncharacterized protein with PIN domain
MVVDTPALIALLFGEPLLFKGNDFDQTDLKVIAL